MEIWLDTTDLKTIANAHELEILYGVTTNPSLLSTTPDRHEELLDAILNTQEGPVAVQVVGDSPYELLEQAHKLYKFSTRFIIKIPVAEESLPAMQILSEEGIPFMATAIFEPYQAYLALKLGAKYLAPYYGRIAEGGKDPLKILQAIMQIRKNYELDGKILVAGLKSLDQFSLCLEAGCEAATLKKPLYDEFIHTHPLTKKAQEEFKKDWQKTQSTLLWRK